MQSEDIFGNFWRFCDLDNYLDSSDYSLDNFYLDELSTAKSPLTKRVLCECYHMIVPFEPQFLIFRQGQKLAKNLFFHWFSFFILFVPILGHSFFRKAHISYLENVPVCNIANRIENIVDIVEIVEI